VKKYILAWIACITASVVWVGAQTTAASNAVVNASANGAAVTNLLTATNAAAQSAARTTAKTGGGYLGLIVWGAIIAAVFVFLWTKGYLVKIRDYVAETQEELRKCSWPSRDELKGSTVVIMVTVALLGVFTVLVDWILSNFMRVIT
jgi:preprotein translocase subunit SecE